MYDKIEDLTRDKSKYEVSICQNNNVIIENLKEIDKLQKNLDTYCEENKNLADAKFEIESNLQDLQKENTQLSNKIKLLT